MFRQPRPDRVPYASEAVRTAGSTQTWRTRRTFTWPMDPQRTEGLLTFESRPITGRSWPRHGRRREPSRRRGFGDRFIRTRSGCAATVPARGVSRTQVWRSDREAPAARREAWNSHSPQYDLPRRDVNSRKCTVRHADLPVAARPIDRIGSSAGCFRHAHAELVRESRRLQLAAWNDDEDRGSGRRLVERLSGR